MSYMAKNELVAARQLKTQRISVPFAITYHATPASKVIAVDEPGILFLQVEGIDQITEASGAIADDSTLPTMTGETDTTGIFFVALKIGETVEKVVSVKLVSRGATLEILPCEVLAMADSSKVILAKVNSAIDLSAASMNAVIECEYVV